MLRLVLKEGTRSAHVPSLFVRGISKCGMTIAK